MTELTFESTQWRSSSTTWWPYWALLACLVNTVNTVTIKNIRWHLLYYACNISFQFSVCCLNYAVCNGQCEVCTVQCTQHVWSTYAMLSVQCAAFIVRYAVWPNEYLESPERLQIALAEVSPRWENKIPNKTLWIGVKNHPYHHHLCPYHKASHHHPHCVLLRGEVIIDMVWLIRLSSSLPSQI